MHIFLIITSFDIGGAERVAINIAKSKNPQFTYHLIEVVKGNSSFSNELKEELETNNILFHCSPFENKKIAICLFWVWFSSYYVRYKPVVIHAHTEIPDLALWIFRRISWLFRGINPRYLRTIHNTLLWDQWGQLGELVERYYLKHQSNIAISTSTQDSYVKRFGGSNPPIIYNGLEEVKQKLFEGIKEERINILFAGRLEYQKGIDELIAVIKAFQDDVRFYFTVVGNGSMKEKMEKAFEGLKNVSMYDKIFGLSHYLSSFDYLIMPSNHEGLALMSIEASLAHTPTIMNRCPGLVETLPNNWKLAVNHNDVTGFVRIISSLSDMVEYRSLAELAYRFACENFSIERMQEQYELLYRNKSK